MAPVIGRPFLDWIIAFLRRGGIQSCVLSTGHLAEVIASYYASGRVDGVQVECVREDSPLGTAGGFLHAATESSFFGRTKAWLVLNGDSLTVASLKPLLELADSEEFDGGLLAVPVPDASRFGTLEVDANGLLRRFREKQPGAGLINAGVYLLKADQLKRAPTHRPLSFETELFPELIHSGARLRVITCQAEFLDIGTPETLHQAESFVSANASWF